MTATPTHAAPVTNATLLAYRDDLPGLEPLATRLAAITPGTLLTTLLGVAPLVAALALRDETLVAVAALWALPVLTATIAKPLDGALSWLVVPLVRFVDYATVIAMFLLDGPAAGAATFAFLAPVVLHHYDIVYRLRHQRRPPPSWIASALMGWQGRVVLAAASGLVGAQTTIGYAYGVVASTLVVTEIVSGWRAFFAAERQQRERELA